MTAKTLLVAVLALFPIAAASAARPLSGNVAEVTGYGAYARRGDVKQMATAQQRSMSQHIRGLVRRVNGTGRAVGEGNRGAAFAALYLPVPVGGNIRMLRAGTYHGPQGETGSEISMDGIEDDLELTLVGQTSVHDLTGVADLDQRIATDHMGIKLDGRLVHSSLSGDAGLATIKLPHGTRSLQYVRLAGHNGYEVGGVSGYPAGRDFTLSWPTPKSSQ